MANPIDETTVIENGHDPEVTPDKANHKAKKAGRKKAEKKAKKARNFPAMAFEQALDLADVIQKHGSGQPMRRITIFDHLDKSPESSASRLLITASSKYGVTTGGYQAEHITLTSTGAIASNPDASGDEVLRARFKLAIEGIEPFKVLYDTYKGLKRPATTVMIDKLLEVGVDGSNATECVDIFIVNAQYLGLIRAYSGSERIITIEQAIEELPQHSTPGETVSANLATRVSPKEATKWEKVCFYIAPNRR